MAQNTGMSEAMEGEILPPEDSGRGGDTILAHLSLGEVVIPRAFMEDPDVMQMLQALFQQNGSNLREFTVGDQANKINPETGYPEFFKIGKIFKSVAKVAVPAALGYFAPGIGSALGGSLLGAGAAGSATLGNAIIGGGVGALTGGGLKGALTGALSGGIGANIGSLGSGLQGATQSGAPLDSGGSGILGAVRSATGISNADISSIGGLIGGGGNSGGGSTFNTLTKSALLANALGGVGQDAALKKVKGQQLDANTQQQQNLESFDPSGITSDPGYQFGLDQGQDALNKSLGAQGNVFSGRAIKEGTEFGQNYGTNAFKDYYNRWLTKTGAKNQLVGTAGDIRANATAGQANNLAQSLSNAFGSAVGQYDPNSIRRLLGIAGA